MKAKELQKLGLSEKEARIYLACLELNHGSAQRISEKAGLPKSTTYDILKVLTQKNLLSTYVKRGRKQFTPYNPEILREKLRKQNEILEGLLPQLRALYTESVHKPKIRFYEGKSGIRIALKEILNEAKEILCISSVEEVFAKFPDYFPEFPKERIKHKIPIRIITKDSLLAREQQLSGPQELRQIKITETGMPFRSFLYMWQDKMAMITLKEDLMIVIIESRDIVDTFRAVFELLWEKESRD